VDVVVTDGVAVTVAVEEMETCEGEALIVRVGDEDAVLVPVGERGTEPPL
jgi:hypothetical protein